MQDVYKRQGLILSLNVCYAFIAVGAFERIADHVLACIYFIMTFRTLNFIKILVIIFEMCIRDRYIQGTRVMYLLEEGIKSGGIAEKITAAVLPMFSDMQSCESLPNVIIHAVDNRFISHGSIESLYKERCV